MTADAARQEPPPVLRDTAGLMAAAGLALRPIADADYPFLRALYASARADGHFLAHWPAPQREAFFNSQFQAQDIHYRRVNPDGDFLVVERQGDAIGRLVLNRGATDWRIVTVELIPEARNQGAGTALMRTVLASAEAVGAQVSLHVEIDSPARALYARLGFAEAGDTGTHIKMIWTPLS